MKNEVIGKKATFECRGEIHECKVVSMNESGQCLVEVGEDSVGWGMYVLSQGQRECYCVPVDYDSKRDGLFGYFINIEELTFILNTYSYEK
jgi:hypothetical protein